MSPSIHWNVRLNKLATKGAFDAWIGLHALA